jgi:hypothetical protein
MAGYIGTQAVSVNTTSATISDDLTVGDDVLLTSDAAVLKIGADADLQLTHSGSVGTITNGTGNLTLDVAGDIILDADGGDLKFHDGGTHIGSIYNDSTNLAIYSKVNNAEMRFIGVDGGSDVTALTFDMAAEGNAHFNRSIGVGFAALPTGSNFDSLRLGGAGFFMSNSNTDASGINAMAHNAQYDADNSWEYIATDEAEYYYQSSGTHRFLSAASGTAGNDITWVDRVEFEADGDVRIYDGNLVVATAHGIAFGNASGNTKTIVSNLLEDYEEGTHQTAITMSTSGTATLNTSFDRFSYTKIGRLVTITGNPRIASVSSPVGNMSLTIPFTALSGQTDELRAGGIMRYYDNSAGAGSYSKPLAWAIQEGASAVVIDNTGTNGNNLAPAASDEFYFSISYMTA